MALKLEEDWVHFWDSVTSLDRELARSSAVLVNSSSCREQMKAVVQHYFRNLRQGLTEVGLEGHVSILDSPLQDLLRLSNGKNRRTSIRKVVRELKAARSGVELEFEQAIGGADVADHGDFLPAERAIVETLSALVPLAAASYKQALLDMHDTNRISFRGTAAELREALRETLDRLAPDGEVAASAGFKLEKDQSKPTMKQKARFILKSRNISSAARAVTEDAIERVESAVSAITRSVYSRGSVGAHTETQRDEIVATKMYLDGVFVDLLKITI